MPTLADFGSRVGSDFNQSQHRDGAHPNGFCHGACIDWMRRMLGGGRASVLDDPAKKRTPDQQAQRAGANVQRMKRVYDRVNDQVDKIDAHNTETIKNWQTLPAAARSEWNDVKRVHGPWGYVWKSFMTELDTESRKGRAFSDVIHMRGQAAREYPTVREFLGDAVKVSEFDKWFDTALLVGPSWKKNGMDNGGHAMVLYRRNTGSILLFDPNFGCYQVDGNVLKALEFLCDEEYKGWGTFYKGCFDRFAGPRTVASA